MTGYYIIILWLKLYLTYLNCITLKIDTYICSISNPIDSQWCTKRISIICARFPLDSSDAQSFKPLRGVIFDLSTHL